MKNFTYGYAEIAEASRTSEGAVRVAVTRRRLKPDDLQSVAIYVVGSMLSQYPVADKERGHAQEE